MTPVSGSAYTRRLHNSRAASHNLQAGNPVARMPKKMRSAWDFALRPSSTLATRNGRITRTSSSGESGEVGRN